MVVKDHLGDGPVIGVVLDELLVLLVELLAAALGDAVAEHRAVEVVGLVLESACQQPGAEELDRRAGVIGAGDGGDIGSGTRREGTR